MDAMTMSNPVMKLRCGTKSKRKTDAIVTTNITKQLVNVFAMTDKNFKT